MTRVCVPRAMFMCKPHWFMVPRPMRDAVWAAYVPGQENRLDPTSEYLEVTRQAIDVVANRAARVDTRTHKEAPNGHDE